MPHVLQVVDNYYHSDDDDGDDGFLTSRISESNVASNLLLLLRKWNG